MIGKKFPGFLLCLLVLPVFTGCSLLLHSTRKSESDLIRPESTRDQIRKSLGGVISSVEFSSPRKLESLPEWEKMAWDAPDFPLPKTIGYDNCRYFGALESEMAGVVSAMGIGMTLGLSELYLIPAELSWRQEEKKSGNAFRIYYAESGHWLLYRTGEEKTIKKYHFNHSYWRPAQP